MSVEVSKRDPSFTVRAAMDEDAEQLAPLMRAEAEHGLRFAPHVDLDEGFSWGQLVAQKLKSRRTQILVAESEEHLIGYLELRTHGQARVSRAGAFHWLGAWRKRGRAPSPVRMPARATIEGCFVAESARRQGIASALLETVLDWARSRAISRLELGAMARNTLGHAFWQSRGFSTYRALMSRDT